MVHSCVTLYKLGEPQMEKVDKWLRRHSVDGRALYLVPVTSQDLKALLEQVVTTRVGGEKSGELRRLPSAELRSHRDV